MSLSGRSSCSRGAGVLIVTSAFRQRRELVSLAKVMGTGLQGYSESTALAETNLLQTITNSCSILGLLAKFLTPQTVKNIPAGGLESKPSPAVLRLSFLCLYVI